MFASQTSNLGPFYGIAGHWCWVSVTMQVYVPFLIYFQIKPNFPLQRAFLHYAPMLLSALISIVCYGLVFFALRGNLQVDAGKFSFHSSWNGGMKTNEDYRTFLQMLAKKMLWFVPSHNPTCVTYSLITMHP